MSTNKIPKTVRYYEELSPGVIKICVNVKAGAKISEITKDEEEIFISVKSPPQKGKANKEIIKLLSKQFGIPKSGISFISGMTSSRKYFRIELENPEDQIKRIKSKS